MKSVCGLDVHRDSVYLCILSEFGELIEKVFGVLTYQLEEMRDLMLTNEWWSNLPCFTILLANI